MTRDLKITHPRTRLEEKSFKHNEPQIVRSTPSSNTGLSAVVSSEANRYLHRAYDMLNEDVKTLDAQAPNGNWTPKYIGLQATRTYRSR